MQYRGERPVDEIELYLFPGKKSSFDYYEDDGVSFEYQQGKYVLSHIELEKTETQVELSIVPGNGTAVRKWSIVAALDGKPEKVLCNDKEIPFTWDDSRKELRAELPSTGKIVIR